MEYQPLIRTRVVRTWIVSILAGLVFGAAVQVPFLFIFVVTISAIASSVWVWRYPYARTVCVVIVCVGFGMMRAQVLHQAPIVYSFTGDHTGTVSDTPRLGATSQAFVFVTDNGTGASIRIVAHAYPRFAAGDWLLVSCSSITDDGTCIFPDIHRLGSGRGNPISLFFQMIRGRAADQYTRVVSAPADAVVTALVLGDRTDVPAHITDVFRATGTTHVIAISGANMVVLTSILLFVLRMLPISPHNRGFVLLCLVAGYTLLVGAPASAVRGALFSALLIIAEMTGRCRGQGHAILIVAVCMLVLQPAWLTDLGFQLSFLATIGIVYGVPILDAARERWLPQLSSSVIGMMLWTGAAASGVATVMTTPLTLATIGTTSIVAIPANIVIGPIVEYLFASGIALLFVAPIPFVGMVAGYMMSTMISVYLFVLERFASLPITIFSFQLHPIAVLIIYGVLFIGGASVWRRVQEQQFRGVASLSS